MNDLSKITALAAHLNQKSNQVNKILEDFEARLKALNLGLEVWLTRCPIKEKDTSHWVPFDDRSKDPVFVKENVSYILGFGKCSDKYTLLVKKQVEHWDEESASWGLYKEGDPNPLLMAQRQLRIEALTKMDALVKDLEMEAEWVLENIERSVDFVNSM